MASPAILDPNFRRSLVYVLQHDAEGTAGVILNRHGGATAAEMGLPDWAHRASVRHGGPVSPESLLALAPADAVPEGMRGPGAPGICVVDLDGQAPAPIHGLRIFVGYSGWAAGQLAAEMARDDWHVVRAEAADVLAVEPGDVWAHVMRRQRDATRLWITLPQVPAAN